MVLVVGYDHHPPSRAALVFAGELAGALNVPLHIVYVIDDGDDAGDMDTERRHLGEAFGAVHLQWAYHRLPGDPVKVLLEAADEHAASMIVVGLPETGIGAAIGHLMTGNVTRKLLRHSKRPVMVVPEFRVVPQ